MRLRMMKSQKAITACIPYVGALSEWCVNLLSNVTGKGCLAIDRVGIRKTTPNTFSITN